MDTLDKLKSDIAYWENAIEQANKTIKIGESILPELRELVLLNCQTTDTEIPNNGVQLKGRTCAELILSACTPLEISADFYRIAGVHCYMFD